MQKEIIKRTSKTCEAIKQREEVHNTPYQIWYIVSAELAFYLNL